MFKSLYVIGTVLLFSGASLRAHDAPATAPKSNNPKIGVVNFKEVIEESKFGKREQGNFEALKKQMETIVQEKEKALNEISAKFNDPDYLDGLSDDAERELKHKFRTMSQELSQIESQYYQTLNQANMKILQDLNDLVAESSTQVAKNGKFDVILNDDGLFYFSNALNITKDVVTEMDKKFEEDAKKTKK
jgi:outer membrane protein